MDKNNRSNQTHKVNNNNFSEIFPSKEELSLKRNDDNIIQSNNNDRRFLGHRLPRDEDEQLLYHSNLFDFNIDPEVLINEEKFDPNNVFIFNGPNSKNEITQLMHFLLNEYPFQAITYCIQRCYKNSFSKTSQLDKIIKYILDRYKDEGEEEIQKIVMSYSSNSLEEIGDLTDVKRFEKDRFEDYQGEKEMTRVVFSDGTKNGRLLFKKMGQNEIFMEINQNDLNNFSPIKKDNNNEINKGNDNQRGINKNKGNKIINDEEDEEMRNDNIIINNDNNIIIQNDNNNIIVQNDNDNNIIINNKEDDESKDENRSKKDYSCQNFTKKVLSERKLLAKENQLETDIVDNEDENTFLCNGHFLYKRFTLGKEGIFIYDFIGFQKVKDDRKRKKKKKTKNVKKKEGEENQEVEEKDYKTVALFKCENPECGAIYKYSFNSNKFCCVTEHKELEHKDGYSDEDPNYYEELIALLYEKRFITDIQLVKCF